MIKILTVIGSRPQFIKAALLSKLIRKKKKIKETILHTGQHYDYMMSENFFKELKIPKPKFNLNIKSKTHSQMIGNIMIKIEKILTKEKFDYVMVYGDTDSTLGGALAAYNLNIPIIHIESGMRSFNKKMPEERNRILTDHCSSILFVPTEIAKQNLLREGIKEKSIFLVGDIMKDIHKVYSIKKKINKNLVDIFVTIHRAENTNSKSRLLNIVKNLNRLSNNFKIIFPIHPRTLKFLKKYKLQKTLSKKINCLNPLSYKKTMNYLNNAKMLITDSGGMQKEAYYSKIPTLTVRNETEWPETINLSWNRLVKPVHNSIYNETIKYINSKGKKVELYGKNNVSKIILKNLMELKK